MKTLVIHPTDSSTKFLSVVYEGKDWTVLTKSPSRTELLKIIKEHDRIIMMGHGSGNGLFDFIGMHFFIDSTFAYLLRKKICVCVWCNADIFVEKHRLKGYYTGMIISELHEAEMYNIPLKNYQEIHESNLLLADSLKNALDSENFLPTIKESYNGDTPLIDFNKNRIYERIN